MRAAINKNNRDTPTSYSLVRLGAPPPENSNFHISSGRLLTLESFSFFCDVKGWGGVDSTANLETSQSGNLTQ